MTIGQRILQARQEAGLSQRQLAGEHMTRNMLSALEHDKAKPSLESLMYLAQMLGKPVGYFLGEQAMEKGAFEGLLRVRDAYDRGDWNGCLDLLAALPREEMTRREMGLLELLCLVEATETALKEKREIYARELLSRASKALADCPYAGKAMTRRLGILRVRAASSGRDQARLAREIPEDGALTARAAGALAEGRWKDAERYLAACDDRDGEWHFLLAEALFGLEDYAGAAEHYHKVEAAYGKPVWKKLELCYANQKNFEMAYKYAIMK